MHIPFVSSKKKIGLALGSGGVRGLAHLGVLKVLNKYDVKIDYIAGASIGAWVGAHYALYQDIALLEHFTVGKRREKFSTLMELTVKGGFVKGGRVLNLFSEWLNDCSFEDTRLPLRIVATDIITGDEVVFSRGKLAPAVRASISVPSIFQPFDYKENVLIDGGVSNPIPVSTVREMGADVVIAVNLDNYQREGLFSRKEAGSVARVTTRSIDLLRHHLAKQCVADADIVIEPDNASEDLSRWRNYFTDDIGAEHVRKGEVAAEAEVQKLLSIL